MIVVEGYEYDVQPLARQFEAQGPADAGSGSGHEGPGGAGVSIFEVRHGADRRHVHLRDQVRDEPEDRREREGV